ncbi:hypothetical protein BRARA_I03641 [Brassica rapa]|uniref:UDP-glucuronate decarboxylase n=1 Tax=Brassica campestris TaxID=3711 RepID=A0A397Y058_BRACM|nr:hypothetical protein BRARA_I03641 [Brassica rapa]
MKQLHKQMSSKRDDDTIPTSQSSPYSPKALKHPRSLPRSLHYLFREQRLLFILVGILIGSTFFILQPSLSRLSPAESTSLIARSASSTDYSPSRMSFNYGGGKTGRVPVGINPRRLRIVVTGGAGFVGREFTMLELAEVVKEVIDTSATIEFKPNTADDPHKRKPDISKAKELLNWEPKISLRDGLPRMVSDFRNRILNEDEGKGL